jgi:hypothetical protein
MSIEMWPDPNNPGKEYPVGTEGWVFNDSGRPNNILDDVRDGILAAIRTLFPGIGYIPSMLVGWIVGDGAWCPTYGLWAGPGWASVSERSKWSNKMGR